LDTGFLLESSIRPGFDHLFKSLNDLCIDIPAAFSLAELWVKKCEKHEFLDASIVEDLPKP
jgi:hypothetical protein